MRKWLLLFALPVSALFSAPFTFNWGASFESVKSSVSGQIKAEKPGELLVVMDGSLEYRYFFYQKKKVREVRIRDEMRDGRKVYLFDELILEDDGEKKDAPLFSVSIRFPSLPFTGESGEQILGRLKETYGRPGNVSSTSMDFENNTTIVRMYLENIRNHAYLTGIVFSSILWTARMKSEQDALKKESDVQIRRRIEEASRTGEKGSNLDQPSGLNARLISERQKMEPF